MSRRVVITGLGVVSPNGIGLTEFEESIKTGKSGIKYNEKLDELKFACQISAIPEVTDELKAKYYSPLFLKFIENKAIIFGGIAGIDAWRHAGLEPFDDTDWDSGVIFGCGSLAMDQFIGDKLWMVQAGKTRHLGSRVIEQTMNSGVSAFLGGHLGLGNLVASNSSACSTGTEAVFQGYERIKAGKAKRLLCGSCESHGAYNWAAFDSMRILCRDSNDHPERGSRPMSVDAAGFVPGTGAGALVLEDLDIALDRGATIYAEILGGEVNSGGQRNGGTMTAPSSEGVTRCINTALSVSGISSNDIDGICGHLTSTMADPLEIKNWSEALNRTGKEFPYINAMKSMIGHCLGAAGSIELVGTVLQLRGGYFHGSLNSETLHPDVEKYADKSRIPQRTINFDGEIIAKASFGFGDINACLILKKWKKQ
ncbi:MAG: beta-ketoacyl-[acyl-carrier-protein] synthase family protein [Cyclobacteriaceae bacterium]